MIDKEQQKNNENYDYDSKKIVDKWLEYRTTQFGDKNKDEKSKNIITIAAFCFSVISWYATSNGLKNYIFKETESNGGIQAYLLSFAIQSILFALSINICKHIDFENNKIASIGTILLYLLLITTSSLFSYVYISNEIYNETKYVDANIYLDSYYREIIYNTDLYIDEYKRYLLYSIGEESKELSEIMKKEGINDVSEEEIEKIEGDLNNLKADYDVKEIEMNSKKEVMDNWGESLRDNSWKSDERKQEIEDQYNEAVIEYETAVSSYSEAKLLYEQKIKELDEKNNQFNESYTGIVNSLFAEALSTDVDIEKLDKYAVQISSKLEELEKNIIDTENFNMIIEYMRDITQDISYYEGLVYIESEYLDLVIDDSDSIIVPINKNNDEYNIQVEEWEKYWSNKYSELEKNIKNLPVFFTGKDKVTPEINIEQLENYNITDIVNKMDDYKRKYIDKINDIEQSFNYLTNKYRIMAWFSLLFSVFMDLSALLVGIVIYSIDKEKKQR